MVHVAPAWAYKQVTRPVTDLGEAVQQELDALGADGWELAGVTADRSTVHFFFKRPR
jgi:hypothetical protein